MKMLPSPVVLNVDDNEPGLYAKSRILKRAGFTVIEARDGATAMALVARESPQLVLLDVQLPDISGLEICRRIKSDPATRRIPVLHISATHVTEADQKVGMESGAEIYLVEPLAPEELITVVRTLLRLRQSEAGLAASEQRLRLATESAGLATMDIDMRTGDAVWSANMHRILGYESAPASANLAQWTERIHPEDLPATMSAFEAAQQQNGQFRHEHRILRKDDGAERWLSPTGLFHADETGRRTRYIGVVRDVTERSHADAERNELLRRESAARLAAEDAARLKDQFLATLSHELRTPMSAVLGWLHLLRSGKLGNEQQAHALETIERNARLQNQLINDLLDVSRIVTGQLRVDLGEVVPSILLESAIETVGPQAAARKISIRLAIPDETCVVWGDASRLQQVFINLLVNAIKFSTAEGVIDVSMLVDGRNVRIRFADRGEGIPPEMLPMIFERFRQADGSITRKHGGMGLGLAIVRHIVGLHGGSVVAASDGRGSGATFTVTLPHYVSSEARGRDVDVLRTASVAAARDDRLQGVHALLVDDDADALAMLASMLELGGANVTTAQGADEALSRFEADPGISVLLSDIGMPGRDGYDLITTLRREFPERGSELAAIALTGYARHEDNARALEAGFDAHLAKPFEMDALFDAITALARRRGEKTRRPA